MMTEKMMDKYYAKRNKDKAGGFVHAIDVVWDDLNRSGMCEDQIVDLLVDLTGESEDYIRFLGSW